MSKNYEIYFSQKFEETRVIEANDQAEAESKLRDEWELSTGAEVEIFRIKEVQNERV